MAKVIKSCEIPDIIVNAINTIYANTIAKVCTGDSVFE